MTPLEARAEKWLKAYYDPEAVSSWNDDVKLLVDLFEECVAEERERCVGELLKWARQASEATAENALRAAALRLQQDLP